MKRAERIHACRDLLVSNKQVKAVSPLLNSVSIRSYSFYSETETIVLFEMSD